MNSLMNALKPAYLLLGFIILGIVLHWGIWNQELFGIHEWRQTQTMQVVENFATEDHNILNPRVNSRGDGTGIFRMEFPLMQWIFSWFFLWSGGKIIAIRIATFLISLLSVIGVFNLLKTYNLPNNISALGAWCFGWSPVLFYYSVNPMPDNLALALGIWSLIFLRRYSQHESGLNLIAFGFFLCLATLVKLPFILFGAALIPSLVGNFRVRPSETIRKAVIIYFLMAPALIWYGWVIPSWGQSKLLTGVASEAAFDYGSALITVWGIQTSLLPELFVNYGALLFFLIGVRYVFLNFGKVVKKYTPEFSILIGLVGFILYEINLIGVQHDYYLFPFLPLIFMVVAKGIQIALASQYQWLHKLTFVALLALPLLAFARTHQRWDAKATSKILEEYREELRSDIPNEGLVVVGNDLSTYIFLYHINRKGWSFTRNEMSAELLQDYINRGAKYLYSNSNEINTKPELQPFLETAIYSKPGMTVYPLRTEISP